MTCGNSPSPQATHSGLAFSCLRITLPTMRSEVSVRNGTPAHGRARLRGTWASRFSFLGAVVTLMPPMLLQVLFAIRLVSIFLFPISYFLFPISYFLFFVFYFMFSILYFMYFLFSIFYFLCSIFYFLFSIFYFLFSIFYFLFSIFYFLFFIFYFLFSIFYFLFSIFYFLFSIFYFLFSIFYFLFPISYFLFSISYFLSPIFSLLFSLSYFLFPIFCSYFHIPIIIIFYFYLLFIIYFCSHASTLSHKPKIAVSNDMWQFSPYTLTWTYIPPSGDYYPTARLGPAAWVLDDELWMFGGLGVGPTGILLSLPFPPPPPPFFPSFSPSPFPFLSFFPAPYSSYLFSLHMLLFFVPILSVSTYVFVVFFSFLFFFVFCIRSFFFHSCVNVFFCARVLFYLFSFSPCPPKDDPQHSTTFGVSTQPRTCGRQ
jgi:hypothetical protein